MKLARFKWQGKIRYGVVEGENILSVSGNIFRKFKIGSVLCKVKDVRFLSPVKPLSIVCVGLNYEIGLAKYHERYPWRPEQETPVLFLKSPVTVIGHQEDIVYPAVPSKEVLTCGELVVVISKKAKFVPESEAKKYILGYTCGNDLAAIDIMDADTARTFRAHNFDTFTSLGPVINTDITSDRLRITNSVNGKVVNEGNTGDMLYSVSKILSLVSQVMTLLPGDIIFMGTPCGGSPINIGDVVEAEIEGIGTLQNKVVAPE